MHKFDASACTAVCWVLTTRPRVKFCELPLRCIPNLREYSSLCWAKGHKPAKDNTFTVTGLVKSLNAKKNSVVVSTEVPTEKAGEAKKGFDVTYKLDKKVAVKSGTTDKALSDVTVGSRVQLTGTPSSGGGFAGGRAPRKAFGRAPRAAKRRAAAGGANGGDLLTRGRRNGQGLGELGSWGAYR
ncbi:MAG: hypothetical protein COZ06_08405 [Armatimonadetes bacterium CG_4_10_14_3_um_filter_66_18]|nr:MAG: hypothetical protein AUJ96_19890 [Armatimonadetes bacterium CG2_30_66_41]PIU90748.1 MAG: hypothetical protein COS65_24195 [Armatimonadetes bacterium CG06_land_8_20_14_3_00_66_21]PIY50630.1 MAG: hypothetical protein COZ06_08405 [Armatimonadetes bacterium CG_4_10_14_3_um_filter_66_18]PIZ32003.1 MAG: hypothetical protein COY42_31915 [Armatimonadetes bacterium CG_4_10_14_0_8_um_filter_66_14]